MSTTLQKHVRDNKNSTGQKVPLKGLFMNGIWHCNCKPRLPAAHFMVRKDGPNKGRWFYTCQEQKQNSCGFFLWDDDATGREMQAVINNSRSEPAADLEIATTRDIDTPDKRTVEGHIEASEKWMSNLAKQEEDEFGDWPLSTTDEISIVGAINSKAITEPLYPRTPRKVIKVDKFSTPSSKRKWDESNGLPTPFSARTDLDVFTTPSTARLKGSMWDGNERPGIISPSITPTPGQFHDINQFALSSDITSDPRDSDITQEIMEILQDQNLEEETETKLRQVLDRHIMKDRGIAMGRDMTRIALKARDARIAELEQRITALENEREMDKLVISHFKSDVAHGMHKNSRGRGKPLGI